jgi:dTDP-4-dehydrorhamnose reductase
VVAVRTADLAEAVQRPPDSTLALDHLQRAWGVAPPPWRAALQACLDGCDNPPSPARPPSA